MRTRVSVRRRLPGLAHVPRRDVLGMRDVPRGSGLRLGRGRATATHVMHVELRLQLRQLLPHLRTPRPRDVCAVPDVRPVHRDQLWTVHVQCAMRRRSSLRRRLVRGVFVGCPMRAARPMHRDAFDGALHVLGQQ